MASALRIELNRQTTTMKDEMLSVTGMACDACVEKVTRAVDAVEGVKSVSASYSDGIATVQYDEEIASPVLIRKAIETAGYGVDGATVPHVHHEQGVCCCRTTGA